MDEIKIEVTGHKLDQEAAQQMALILARRDNPETMVIARCNRPLNSCSPCALKGNLGDRPGWEVYGESHGGRLKITVNNGDYVFICT